MSSIKITFRTYTEFFLQISVHQNAKANGKQQLGVPVRTFIFSLFLPENFFQSKINNCGNIDKFM